MKTPVEFNQWDVANFPVSTTEIKLTVFLQFQFNRLSLQIYFWKVAAICAKLFVR
jgi:hypothetical protein